MLDYFTRCFVHCTFGRRLDKQRAGAHRGRGLTPGRSSRDLDELDGRAKARSLRQAIRAELRGGSARYLAREHRADSSHGVSLSSVAAVLEEKFFIGQFGERGHVGRNLSQRSINNIQSRLDSRSSITISTITTESRRGPHQQHR
jgi:hypothetical protein